MAPLLVKHTQLLRLPVWPRGRQRVAERPLHSTATRGTRRRPRAAKTEINGAEAGRQLSTHAQVHSCVLQARLV